MKKLTSYSTIKTIRRIFIVFAAVFFSFSFFVPHQASAFTKDQRFQLERQQYYDPTDCGSTGSGSSPTTPTPSSGGIASGKVYMIGDSITQGTKPQLEATLKAKGFSDVIVNGLSSRRLSLGEGDLDGIGVFERDQSKWADAGTIIIALGTNGTINDLNISKIIADAKSGAPSAKIYWVNLGAVNRPEITNNNALIQQLASKGYSVIDWATVVKDHPDYISTADGLGVHPGGAGIQAFADTVANGAASGGGGTASATASPVAGGCACSVGAGSGSGGGSTVLVGSDNAEKIYKFLVGKGLTPFQAAGIMGNIQAESNFDPGIVEGGNGIGYGIIQWSFGRRTKLEAAAAAKGVPVSDLAFQLDYLWEELNQSYKGPLDAIKASTTIEEATEIFETRVEIHGAPPIQDQRKKNARGILALYGSEGGTTGTTGGSSSASASCSTPTTTSGSTIDANLPQGSKDELITQIKATNNVTNVNLINNQMKRTTLAVILKLAQKYKFTATSAIRGGGGPHSNGSAIDIVNINGKGVPSGQDYAPINEDADNFARDAATLLPGHSWMGVPNDHYKQITNPIMTTKGGSSDLDTPATTGATGPHFHLNCPADAE